MMKLFLLSLFFVVALVTQSWATNFFWVGGNGTWDNLTTTNWALSSNGAGGNGPPTASDTAIFDSNSGTGTAAVVATAACGTCTFGGANMVILVGAGVTMGNVTVTAGTLTTGAFTSNFTSLTSITGTRTLTLTNSTINITGTSGTPWNVTTGGTLTQTMTGSTINFTGGAANTALTITQPAANAFVTISITGAGNWTLTNGNTFTSLTYTSTTNKTDIFALGGNISVGTGTLVLTGNSSVNRAFVKSTVLGTTRSITANSGATVTTTNWDVQDINMAGTFSTGATASSIGDALGNTFGWSSVQPDVSATQTYSGSGGADNWSNAARWTSRPPLPQDDVILPASPAGSVLTADQPRMGRNITASNFDRTLSFASTPNTIFGNVTLGTDATYSGTQGLTLAGRGAQTITSNGRGFTQAIIMSAYNGSYTLIGNMFNGSNLTLTDGALVGGLYIIQVNRFLSNVSTSRIINGGLFVVGAITTNPWNITASGLSILNSPSVNFSGSVTGSVQFDGGGFTYGTLNWSSPTSTGILIITGANTFAALQSDNTTTRTWQFPNGVTQTILPGGWKISGKAGAVTSIISDSSGLLATLSMRAGNVKTNYLSIKDSTVTGGANWYAGQNSTNVSGNSGWNFRNAPSIIWLLKKKFGANNNWPQNRMAA